VATSFELIERGWRTSFCPDAVVTPRVPTRLDQFWSQRQRWTRGLSREAARAHSLPALLVVSGYADRLVFLASLVAAVCGWVGWCWPVLYFVGPALNVWVALYRARVAGGMAFLRLLSHVRTGRVRHRLRHPIEPTSLETQLAAQSTASRRLRPLMTTSQRCSRNCGPNTSRGRALKAVCSQPMSENIFCQCLTGPTVYRN
jgi:hypothetical protein